MTNYLLRRLFLALLVLVASLMVLFLLIYAVPGDPATIALGPRATEAQKIAFRERMGLDDPLVIQAIRFVLSLMKGDMGTDLFTQRPVLDLVTGALPNTVMLAVAGLGWAVVIGVPLGVLSALKSNSWFDHIVGILSTSVVALPAFLMAIYGLMLFAVTLQWLPAIGAGEPGDLGDRISHLILPAISVGIAWIGYIARLVRVSMLDVLSENHVKTYRAFGVADHRIALRYVLPIAVVPVLSVIGVGMGNLLSGAVLVEVVFSRPGLGSLAYDAVISRNFPVLFGAVVVTTALYVAANFLTDAAVAILDPRVAEKG
ncbi:ABC transporter permease [Celeribacter indicus]|uniref:Peptide/opine ABC transporter inner membrane protein n=1 Tax=Celeribacter indicus TaxID=1208324 RepID=A0A0B5DZK1_9RHOB|nr:ABC transporter permease [Celeribacter indicus]AJE48469.1 peptide/opine ABC transporter inner membrane protein [Celeribacter indicus]SDX28618.1 peptide/nickel transport system permease protein [Celeribacter indicus]